MCLIGIAYRAHPRHELVLAANRDEFHARAAAPAALWTDAPQVLGGRDLTQGGSWLALSTQRRLAAVTNVRRMVPPNPAAPSRGKLVGDFVRGTQSAEQFARQLEADAARYAGFNLLLWDGAQLLYLSNQAEFRAEAILPGVHGLSNATLDTPWPKLTRLTGALRHWVEGPQTGPEPLLHALADETLAPDAQLPNTGVGEPMERFLSPAFIRSERYGTRASTVVLADPMQASFVERRFGPNGILSGESRKTFDWAL